LNKNTKHICHPGTKQKHICHPGTKHKHICHPGIKHKHICHPGTKQHAQLPSWNQTQTHLPSRNQTARTVAILEKKLPKTVVVLGPFLYNTTQAILEPIIKNNCF